MIKGCNNSISKVDKGCQPSWDSGVLWAYMITSKKVFGAYVVERVSYDAFASAATTSPADSFINSRNCAIGDEWTACELVSIQPYNHDTSIFRFKLPHGKIHLNLPIGGFLLALAPNCEHGGGDAIRPYTSVQDDVTNSNKEYGTFELLCKRYDQWGVKESIQTHFLFTKTNHSYRPAGAVSNYIHKLKVGDSLKFKYSTQCIGKIPFPFVGVKSLTLIAVGVGIAPMIQILRGIFKSRDFHRPISSDRSPIHRDNDECLESTGSSTDESPESSVSCEVERVVLLYGVRTVSDILLREQLEAWQEHYGEDTFKVVFCVGSRWNNVHWGAKTKNKEYIPPPLPAGFQTLKHAVSGWVNEAAIRDYGFPPTVSGRVLVCGLPGVYDKLCGPRSNPTVAVGSVLHNLGYNEEHVIKL